MRPDCRIDGLKLRRRARVMSRGVLKATEKIARAGGFRGLVHCCGTYREDMPVRSERRRGRRTLPALIAHPSGCEAGPVSSNRRGLEPEGAQNRLCGCLDAMQRSTKRVRVAVVELNVVGGVHARPDAGSGASHPATAKTILSASGSRPGGCCSRDPPAS